MSKINVYGWMAVLIAFCGMSIVQSACCGGGTTTGSGDLFADAGSASGSASTGGKVKTCNDLQTVSQCSQHQGPAFAVFGEEFYKGLCELTDGTWGTAPCPPENIVGRCDDGEGSVTIYYSAGGSTYDLTSAKEACSFTDGAFTS